MQARPKFVLCWHMHQPWYRESRDGDYRLPWVYLHAIKDYADMAAHLENHPRMRVVINFTPVLLEQLIDYAARLDAWLECGLPTPESLLNVLAGVASVPAGIDGRACLVRACSRAHERNMIDAHPAYRELLDHALTPGGTPKRALLRYLDEQYFLDLVTWYHLAWTGQSLRRHPVVEALIAKGGQFDAGQRRELIEVMRDTIASLVPRYRALAERGQVELSMTPYAHPIVPLLIDFDAMACSQAHAPRPESDGYPGGAARARWHFEHGLTVFESCFGRRPGGVWLSEGGVSDDAVRLLDEYGIAWTASGEGVWANTMAELNGDSPVERRTLFQCHRLPGCGTRVFFRDDGLSDLIGFEYQQWDAHAAARDFAGHVRNIADFIDGDGEGHVISVILDGENAWEFYPDNAHAFIDALYTELETCEAVELSTFGDAVADCAPNETAGLCAGSWVYGSFSTWIGERDKNRAWDCLVEAKRCYDEKRGGVKDPSTAEDIDRQLAICEGSDWFWWFGDYNPEQSVRDFDHLFRRQLRRLYEMLDVPSPAYLDEPLSVGGDEQASGGTMRRGGDWH